MPRQESHEVVNTPDGKRLKVVQTETQESLLDRDAVDRALEYVDGQIQHHQDALTDLEARRAALAAKRDQVDVAQAERTGG